MHPGSTMNTSATNGNVRRAFGDLTNASSNANNGAKQNVLKKSNNFGQNRMIIDNAKPVQNFKASHRNIAKDTTNNVVQTHESNTFSYQYSAPADNIDERDSDEPLCVTDYVQDMYVHFRNREEETSVRPGFMDNQPHINSGMRGILVDWLVEVHLKFRLGAETLYLTINLIDRFLEKREVTRAKLQLIGVTCLLIAAKYEEIYPPELRELVYICDRAYTKEQILDMEEVILKALKYGVTVPSAHAFLVRFLKAAHADKQMVQMSCYILDGTLQSYKLLQFLPSQLAAAAILIARTKSGRHPWSPTLLKYACYCEEDVIPVARAILAEKESAPKELRAVNKKYSSSRFGGIANTEFNCDF